MFENEECITFRAMQRIPIGLLQPAQALFYDYYEPCMNNPNPSIHTSSMILRLKLMWNDKTLWKRCYHLLYESASVFTARKCAVLYSAPQRSKMIAQLCEGSVCQCAESRSLFPGHSHQHFFTGLNRCVIMSNRLSKGPCHKERKFSDKPTIGKRDRQEHACRYPLADYGLYHNS